VASRLNVATVVPFLLIVPVINPGAVGDTPLFDCAFRTYPFESASFAIAKLTIAPFKNVIVKVPPPYEFFRVPPLKVKAAVVIGQAVFSAPVLSVNVAGGVAVKIDPPPATA
jgi:hypothetical protein